MHFIFSSGLWIIFFIVDLYNTNIGFADKEFN